MQVSNYRDRISVYVWGVLATLALPMLLQLPARTLTWTIFGTPLSIEVTTVTFLSIPLLIIAASGIESVIRAHPLHHNTQFSASIILWALPCALALTAVQLLSLISAQLTLVIGLGLTGILLTAVCVGLYHTIDIEDPHYRTARFVLNLTTYLLALVLFLIVYESRARSVLTASINLGLSAMLAVELLRGAEFASRRQILQYGLVIGIVMGEATWALNYWQLSGLTGGLLLLLLFYTGVGLAQHSLQKDLRRAIVLEYVILATMGTILILLFAPK